MTSFVTVIHHLAFRVLVLWLEEHQKPPVNNMEIIEVNEKKDGTDIDYYNNVSCYKENLSNKFWEWMKGS